MKIFTNYLIQIYKSDEKFCRIWEKREELIINELSIYLLENN